MIADEADSVYFTKRKINEKGEIESIPALRGEGLRGLVRNAVARASERDLLTDDHEDCSCLLCAIFGNTHESGLIRFDDLSPRGKWHTKWIDHISIDDCDTSIVEKFDVRALAGSPDSPLVFEGSFWVHKDLLQQAALRAGFNDIVRQVYTVGGKGGCGYGWIDSLDLPEEWLESPSPDADSQECLLTYQTSNSLPNFPSWQPEQGAVYNPYYYLPPIGSGPVRVTTPPSHAHFDEERITGRIECSFKVISPLLLPGTDCAVIKPSGHTCYPAFNLNNTVMVPGSGLKAAVGQAYEILTDSCFRIMNQQRVLSWRMDADEHKNFKPGRIIEGGKSLQPMGSHAYRLPLYDQDVREYSEDYLNALSLLHQEALEENFEKIKSKPWRNYDPTKRTNKIRKCEEILKRQFRQEEKDNLMRGGLNGLLNLGSSEYDGIIKYFESIEVNCLDKAKATDKKISEVARINNSILNKIKENNPRAFAQIFTGKQKIPFKTIKLGSSSNVNFQVVQLLELNPKKDKARWGYLKITGPNNANDSNAPSLKDEGYNQTWENPLDFSFVLSGPPKRQSNTQSTRVYARPAFECVVNEKTITLSKRCERLFEIESPPQPHLTIPRTVREGYRGILEDYKINAKKIPPAFQTKFFSQNALQEGDLVYYQSDGSGKKVEALAPVCISRIADDRPLGKRVAKHYQSCAHVCLEDCEQCTAADCPIPYYRAGYPVNGLCPACLLLGSQMYEGRVKFSFASPSSTIATKKVTLPILERPRLSWVLQKNIKGTDTTSLGRRLPLRHNRWEKIWNGNIEEGKNNCTIEGIKPGSNFNFHVQFENLTKEELGMLLYCLELENSLSHALGRGKTFGFGQILIKVNESSYRTPSGKWRKETVTKDKKVIDSQLVVDAIYKLDALNGLRLLFRQYPDLVAFYPELDGNDGIPGYKELRSSEYYDPYHFLCVQKYMDGPIIYPWFPIPSDQDLNKFPTSTSSDEANDQTGTVKKFEKGYGFIQREGMKDIFFHHSDILDKDSRSMKVGDRVKFLITSTPRGDKAIQVIKI